MILIEETWENLLVFFLSLEIKEWARRRMLIQSSCSPWFEVVKRGKSGLIVVTMCHRSREDWGIRRKTRRKKNDMHLYRADVNQEDGNEVYQEEKTSLSTPQLCQCQFFSPFLFECRQKIPGWCWWQLETIVFVLFASCFPLILVLSSVSRVEE